jgi:hypothetical protein
MAPTAVDRGTAVRFRAPGDDLLCGRVDRFQLATADAKIDPSSFGGAKRLPRSSAPAPKRPGGLIRFDVPAGSKRFIAIRAVDEQGNVSRPVSVRVKPERGGGGGRCGNRIRGTKKADRLRGTNEGDRIGGGRGDDRIRSRGGDDCALGGKGDDRVAGDGGGDRINGGADDDRLRGGAGRDRIAGGTGTDRVGAGGGADRIKVHDGSRDRVSCGGGRDRVVADRRDRIARDCEKVKLRR